MEYKIVRFFMLLLGSLIMGITTLPLNALIMFSMIKNKKISKNKLEIFWKSVIEDVRYPWKWDGIFYAENEYKLFKQLAMAEILDLPLSVVKEEMWNEID